MIFIIKLSLKEYIKAVLVLSILSLCCLVGFYQDVLFKQTARISGNIKDIVETHLNGDKALPYTDSHQSGSGDVITAEPTTPRLLSTNYNIDLKPYQTNPKDLHIQIVEDICIEENPGTNKTHLVSYNSNITKPQEKHQIVAYSFGGRRFTIPWVVLQKKAPMPNNLELKPYPVFFMFEKYPENFFHFINDDLMGIFGLMQKLGRLNASEGNHILRYHCDQKQIVRYREFFDRLGPNIDYGDCVQQAKVKNVCFRHGVFGFLRPDGNRQSFVEYVWKMFGISGRCERHKIILMNRLQRTIVNIQELASAIRELGLPKTDVMVVSFENMSLKEQVRMVYCTRILIGIQGAGMEWFHFMPLTSAVFELGFHRWPTGMYVNLAKRRKLLTDRYDVPAANTTIDWAQYAHANNIANLTDADKQIAIDNPNNVEGWTHFNPYKYGQGTFNVTIFKEKVKTLISKLTNMGIHF